MQNEVNEYLITNFTGTYFDGTLGFGGHATNLLSRLEKEANLFATDKDETAFAFCKNKFVDDKRVSIYNTGFTEIKNIAKLEDCEGFDGIFADLGVSSYQLDNKEAGFTYREDAVLDLRMNKSVGKPAYEFLNNAKQEEIANVFYEFGEERKSRRIANIIVRNRSSALIKTTRQLYKIVEAVTPKQNLNKTLSRIFQSLRIYVNNELVELSEFLSKSVKLLKKGGRIVVLSYHSLEDRIVKEIFKHEALSCVCPTEIPVCACDKKSAIKILTRKPLIPTESEIKSNPRSRSAKFRAAEKL